MGHGEDHRRRPRPAPGPGLQPLTSRLAEVDPERLPGWLERFAASHGPVEQVPRAGDGATSIDLVARDGARAHLAALWPSQDPVRDAVELAQWAGSPRSVLILLVRRGGWGVGLAQDGALGDSRVGTRYVQSRTAAGGWSQQRYARRRSGQAAGLVGAAAEATVELLERVRRDGGPAAPFLAVGGDRALVTDVLADPRLTAVAGLPRSPLLDVPDPRRAVLEDVARRVRTLRIRVDD